MTHTNLHSSKLEGITLHKKKTENNFNSKHNRIYMVSRRAIKGAPSKINLSFNSSSIPQQMLVPQNFSKINDLSSIIDPRILQQRESFPPKVSMMNEFFNKRKAMVKRKQHSKMKNKRKPKVKNTRILINAHIAKSVPRKGENILKKHFRHEYR